MKRNKHSVLCRKMAWQQDVAMEYFEQDLTPDTAALLLLALGETTAANIASSSPCSLQPVDDTERFVEPKVRPNPVHVILETMSNPNEKLAMVLVGSYPKSDAAQLILGVCRERLGMLRSAKRVYSMLVQRGYPWATELEKRLSCGCIHEEKKRKESKLHEAGKKRQNKQKPFQFCIILVVRIVFSEVPRVQPMQLPGLFYVTIFTKGVREGSVSTCIDGDTCEVEMTLADGSPYKHTFPLPSNVADVTVEVTPFKVEVKCRQEGQAQERKEEKPNPYSSRKKPEDWDRVNLEAKKEEEEEKPEGSAALQKMFAQIYGDADDDTKRAMMKSYQTSGGTVLSTNWKEVREKDYEKEIQAPNGQEVRRWNE